jgi:hypothetical protein
MNQSTREAWRRDPQPSVPSTPEETPVRRAAGAGPALFDQMRSIAAIGEECERFTPTSGTTGVKIRHGNISR